VESHLREELLGLVIGNGRVDNNVATLVPVDRCGYPVLIPELQG